MPETDVYTHHTGRKLGTVSLTATQAALLDKPPALADPHRAEDHLVRVGDMVLFRASFNGVSRVVSSTHAAVVAAAAK